MDSGGRLRVGGTWLGHLSHNFFLDPAGQGRAGHVPTVPNAARSQLSGPRMAVGLRPMVSGGSLRVGGTCLGHLSHNFFFGPVGGRGWQGMCPQFLT